MDTTGKELGTLLFILTSHGQLGNTGKSTGYYLPELAHPYEVLSKAYNIRFATPLGGRSPVDPASVEAFRNDPTCALFLNNPQVVHKIDHTERLSDLKPEDINSFAGIFIPGGHGPLYDLATDATSIDIIRRVYENGGVVSSVCHGPAALVNVKLSNGQYLVKDQSVTSFTNDEEDSVGLLDVVPFSLENELIERGAKFSKASLRWEDHVAGEGTRLVTGQNPQSSFSVAHAMLESLTSV